jgi:DUF1680 family protein
MNEKMRYMKLGEIKPVGWMFDQIENDLLNGFVGHLDKLVPDLITNDDIYGKERLTSRIKSKNVGAIAQDGNHTVQYLWWNSETQSNWRDGFVRSSFLINNSEYIEKCRNYVEHILATQDQDGYLGIYDTDLRYNFTTENGELWAKSTLFRTLLAYYEATREEKVLAAIEKALHNTMQHYKQFSSNPFYAENDYAGLTHGLTLTDILDSLYQITGKTDYIKYAVWLYENYNDNKLSEQDIKLENLLNHNYRFTGHGVHTYEHLRTLIIASFNSDDSTYTKALEAYLNKLTFHLAPSGGPIGDEWVWGRAADSTHTGYEFCSLQELLHSYSLLLQKSGNVHWADRIEHLFYNAAQGARHPNKSAIAYCKTDNSYSMVGGRIEGLKLHGVPDNRYKYSPTHQDVAVCCVPNAGRILPYFIQSIYFKTEDGIAVMNYGPSILETELNGAAVKIEQISSYPFNHAIEFTVTVETPVTFKLHLRKPSWADSVDISAGYIISEDTGTTIVLEREWNGRETFEMIFQTSIKIKTDLQGEYYVTYGPLLFALPIESIEETVKTHTVKNHRDLYYRAKNSNYNDLQFNPEKVKEFTIEKGRSQLHKKIDSTYIMKAPLYNSKTKKYEMHELLPMGNTLLRKVTFHSAE